MSSLQKHWRNWPFKSTFTGKSFKINYHLYFNDKYVIYLLSCEVRKKQYTGKTVDRLDYDWTAMRKAIGNF